MKLLVTGSRDFIDVAVMRAALVPYSSEAKLIHGDSRGADRLSEHVWLELHGEGVHVRRYPAAWFIHGKGAGPIRNQEMLSKEHHPGKGDPIGLCLAFPLLNSRGTWDMIHRCEKAGIPVINFTGFLPKF